jgi:hypothetical protein
MMFCLYAVGNVWHSLAKIKCFPRPCMSKLKKQTKGISLPSHIKSGLAQCFAKARWPNWLFKLTPTLRLVPSSRFAPYGAA